MSCERVPNAIPVKELKKKLNNNNYYITTSISTTTNVKKFNEYIRKVIFFSYDVRKPALISGYGNFVLCYILSLYP